MEFAPSPRLTAFVRSIRVMQSGVANTQPVLPAPGLILGFRYAGVSKLVESATSIPIASAGLVGLRTTLRRMQTTAETGVVVVQFSALGAAQFFDEPMNELFGQVVALESLIAPQDFRGVEARLAEAATSAARAGIVDAYLCRRLRDRAPDPLVSAAVASIQRAGGALRIGQLAKQLGITQDPLEKRFRRVVGASPKQLASIARFRRVVSGYERGVALTRLAHELGYFDQSHLIREFRAFTGEAPERFLRAREHC